MSILHSKYDERVNFSERTPLIEVLHFHPEVQTAGELAAVVMHIDDVKSMKKVLAEKVPGQMAQQIERGRRLHSHKRAS